MRMRLFTKLLLAVFILLLPNLTLAVPIIYDTFDGPDDTSLTAHRPNIDIPSNPWELYYGGWVINSATAYDPVICYTYFPAGINCGLTSLTLSANVYTSGIVMTLDWGGVNDNFWYLRSGYSIYTLVGSAAVSLIGPAGTTLASASYTITNGQKITVYSYSNLILVYADNDLLFNYSAAPTAGTYVGFTSYGHCSPGWRFDNFLVDDGSVITTDTATSTATQTSTQTATRTATQTATATFTFTPTFTTVPCGQSLHDTFAGVNGTSLTSHIADTGQQWYNVNNPGFPSNASLYNGTVISTVIGGGPTDGINVFSKDGDAEVTISSLNANNNCQLITRAIPASYPGWQFVYHSGVYRIIHSAGTSVNKTLPQTPAENDRLGIQMAGQSMTFLINGIPVDYETDTDSPSNATWIYIDFDGGYDPETALSNLSVTNWQGCTPTNTPTYTATNTATQTATNTATQTATNTATQTATNTATQTATNTATQTWTPLPAFQ